MTASLRCLIVAAALVAAGCTPEPERAAPGTGPTAPDSAPATPPVRPRPEPDSAAQAHREQRADRLAEVDARRRERLAEIEARRRGRQMWWLDEALAAELGLDARQIDAMSARFHAAQDREQAAQQATAQAQQEYQQALRRDDFAAARNAATQRADAVREAQLARQLVQVDLFELLSAEQRAQLGEQQRARMLRGMPPIEAGRSRGAEHKPPDAMAPDGGD